jgi:hypothetical protein
MSVVQNGLSEKTYDFLRKELIHVCENKTNLQVLWIRHYVVTFQLGIHRTFKT